jgi:hypothetical protein
MFFLLTNFHTSQHCVGVTNTRHFCRYHNEAQTSGTSTIPPDLYHMPRHWMP